MYITHKAGALAAFILLLAGAWGAQSATLSATPPPSVVSGEAYLARPAELDEHLGFVWALNSLYWNAAEEISVQVSISNNPSPSDNALVFFTVGNIDADAWSSFEIDVSGPAQFITDAPYSSSRAFTAKTISEQKITFTFTGIDEWSEGTDAAPTSSNLDFSLNLTPEGPNESIVLTFRPISVPEPASGVLLAVGALVICRRHRNK